MTKATDDISRWLKRRPFQDNPQRSEPPPEGTFETWEEWVNAGKEIQDIEKVLIGRLQNEEDPVNRSAAALALGVVGGEQIVAALVRSLQNDLSIVAMEAAAALGRLGKPETVEPLCEALKHSDSNVRANAAIALGVLGTEKALSCLKSAQQDKDPFVQHAVARALGKDK